MTENTPRKVLIVDDEEQLRKVLLRILGALSVEIVATEAADGSEAIELLKENTYDLVLLDVKMPKVDGLETLRWIRENDATSKVTVMMLTSESALEDIYEGRDRGASFYLTKPFDTADVTALLEVFFKGELG